MTIDSDDDLDDFFTEVSEVQEEARQKDIDDIERTESNNSSQLNEGVNPTTTKEVEKETKLEKIENDPRGDYKRQKLDDNTKVPITATPIIAVAATHTATPVNTTNTISIAASSQYLYPSSSLSLSATSSKPPPPPPPPPLPPGPPPTQQIYSNWNSSTQNSVNYKQLPNRQSKTEPSIKRTAAGTTWEDPTLAEFPPNDFRLFVGNLSKETPIMQLENHFKKDYPSFAMAKICYNKHDGTSKGYGFVSMLDPMDAARAVREKDQTWLGSRPIKVRMSDWKDRDAKIVKKRNKKNLKKGRKHLW